MKNACFILLFLGLMAPAFVKAQGCAVCTSTAQNLDDKSAKGLNGGIIYLAAFPLAILGTIGFIWWKHYKPEKPDNIGS